MLILAPTIVVNKKKLYYIKSKISMGVNDLEQGTEEKGVELRKFSRKFQRQVFLAVPFRMHE